MTVRRLSYSTATQQSRSNRISGFIPVGWATVDSVAGTPTEGSYKEDGTKYKYYKYTGSGSVTFKNSGIVDVMVVAGGGGGSGCCTGGAGGVVWKIVEVEKDQTVTVTVGGGGGNGSASYFGNLVKIGGGQASTTGDITSGIGGGGGQPGADSNGGGYGGTVWGANDEAGIVLTYDNGTSIEYGKSGGGTVNRGYGGSANQGGGSGVVIFRVGA